MKREPRPEVMTLRMETWVREAIADGAASHQREFRTDSEFALHLLKAGLEAEVPDAIIKRQTEIARTVYDQEGGADADEPTEAEIDVEYGRRLKKAEAEVKAEDLERKRGGNKKAG